MKSFSRTKQTALSQTERSADGRRFDSELWERNGARRRSVFVGILLLALSLFVVVQTVTAEIPVPVSDESPAATLPAFPPPAVMEIPEATNQVAVSPNAGFNATDSAPTTTSGLLDTAPNGIGSIQNGRFEKTAGRPFDFSLSGTGDPSSAISGTSENSALDGYHFDESGTNRFIVPKNALSESPIQISADAGWKGPVSADGEEVYILVGHCRVEQGEDVAEGPKGVVRVIPSKEDENVRDAIVYLEKENQWEPLTLNLKSTFLAARATELAWLGTFRTTSDVTFHIERRGASELDPEEIYARALAMTASASTGQNSTSETDLEGTENKSAPSTDPAGSTAPDRVIGGGLNGSGTNSATDDVREIALTSQTSDRLNQVKSLTQGDVSFRRIRLLSRYDRDLNARREADPTNPSRNRIVISGGFILMIEGITSDGKVVSDVIDISADQAVIWAGGVDILQGSENIQNKENDLEIYLEGDIIFREGERVVYAQKMYYDAKNRVGLVKDTEMVIPVPNTPGGYFRISADTISQNGPDTLKATDAWVSTSTMGQPSYRLQSNSLTAEFRKAPLYDSTTGAPAVDPLTGEQAYRNDSFVIAENNFVALENVPVFYWPWMSMNLQNRSLYMRSLKVGSDGTFGTQVRTGWNPYQIFNIKNPPENTDWDINLDYLSKRGLGHGTNYLYNVDSFLGCKSPAIGMASFYGISDKGEDNLGLGRRNDPFPHSYRYRGIWKHRQIFDLPGCFGDDWVLTAQFGKSSDRNYLREYFEEEWFTSPNPETSLEIKKTVNNWSFSGYASVLTDKFYTGTNHFPSFDHYWLGQNLFCNKLLWYEHTKIGLNQFKTTNSPYSSEDRDLFRYLDWELADSASNNIPDAAGTETLSATSFNFSTRHELDVPLSAGPVKVTPYALGEYGFWGQGVDSKNVSRLYGRGGVRADLPVWKVNSDISSRTWYLNGLAHKMNFGLDAYYSAANKDVSELILYDQLDDWQVEDFRRQSAVTTFSNSYSPYRDSIPVRFDERYYALRQGDLGGSVTSPSTEIAGDLTQVRLDWLNRWQTKRGPVGNRHIIDWITFDTGLGFYPKKEQNFDEMIGLVDYDARWHVGDRFSVLSSGLFDFFDSGQKIVRAGVMSKRPGVSNFYLGVDRLGGPIDSTYLNAAINYRMSQKWAASFSNSYDIAEGRNVGQDFGISRIGESFIYTLKLNVNQSKDDWGVSLNVLPIFIFNNKKFEEDILGFGQM